MRDENRSRRKKQKKSYQTDLWKPFMKQHYRDAWNNAYLFGIIKEFSRDCRRAHDRIWKGYTDYDLYSIYDWFLRIMPVMLDEFKDNLHGYPLFEEGSAPNIGHALVGDDIDEFQEEGLIQWEGILDKMIFFLKEASEDGCSKKNPYDEQYRQASINFEKKYGLFGEKLRTEEDLKEERKTGNKRLYLPDDVEENKSISELFFAEEKRLAKYREQCKDEAFALFSKWFYSLWD